MDFKARYQEVLDIAEEDRRSFRQSYNSTDSSGNTCVGIAAGFLWLIFALVLWHRAEYTWAKAAGSVGIFSIFISIFGRGESALNEVQIWHATQSPKLKSKLTRKERKLIVSVWQGRMTLEKAEAALTPSAPTPHPTLLRPAESAEEEYLLRPTISSIHDHQTLLRPSKPPS